MGFNSAFKGLTGLEWPLAATVRFFKVGLPSIDIIFTGHKKKGALGTPKNSVLQDFLFCSCTKIGIRSITWKKVVNHLLVC